MDGDTTHSMREQINAIEERSRRTDARGQENAERLDRLEKCLTENTRVTNTSASKVDEMYNYLITARIGTKMIKGTAAVASAIAALWAAFIWFRDHIRL